MNRRSTEVRGFVLFPIEDPRFKNTGEGGMFVRLLVEDGYGPDDSWPVCCGGYNYVLHDECYLRDDNREPPKVARDEGLTPEQITAEFEREERERREYEMHHFPNLRDAELLPSSRYLSRPYLAVLTIGSTGWSGWDEESDAGSGAYWHCTYDDLTDEGRALYDNLKKLYAGCPIRLQTWLDT